MFGPKSTVLVSIGIGYEQAHGEGEKQYMRPRHTWMISVQPHKHLLPGHKVPEPVHYTSSRDPANGPYIVQRTDGGGHGILGNILIASSAHAMPNEVLHLLQTKAHDADTKLPSEISDDDDSEAWIRRALHALQHDKIIETFDVGEFMTFAHSYVGTRADGNGGTAPAIVPYPKLQAKKATGGGFRISYANTNPNRNGDRVYGGLM